MKILITGGAGFVGFNYATHRARRGDEVWVLDDLSRTGSSERMEKLLEFEENVKRLPDLATCPLSELATFEAIVHLASQVAVTWSFEDPMNDAERNIMATLQLLEQVRRSGSKPRIIFTSTNKVYGSTALGGFNPETPYGISKAAADLYMQDYGKHFGIPIVVLRMSCVYGPHQTVTESDQGWLAHFAHCILKGQQITIYGTGHQQRDVLHVSDLMELFDSLIGRAPAVDPGSVFDAGGGSGQVVSVLGAIKILGGIIGEPVILRFDNWRPGDQEVYISNLARVTMATGWKPKIRPEEGFADLVRWMRG